MVSQVDRFPIDKRTILQNQLDLSNRERKSLFSWRGQFSPGLVELLLTHYANNNAVVFDPFVGSGTTLFEAVRKSMACFGAEISPAAVKMARAAEFATMEPSQRSVYIEKAEAIVKRHLRHRHRLDAFSIDQVGTAVTALSEGDERLLEEMFLDMLNDASENEMIHNIVMNTILHYTVLHNKESPNAFLRAFRLQAKALMDLPFSNKPCKVFHCDARKTPLDDESANLVITSPPYINVFNYHQNYRQVMELIGWDLLAIAKSEIGSNRKNRGNRFLTVVQYAIDMLEALCEMRRIIHSDGRIIVIIGRESKVRDVSFENYKILSALAVGGASLRLICRQERKFVNRFGQTIIEDLLHFAPAGNPQGPSVGLARNIALRFLVEAEKRTAGEVHEDIALAIENARNVASSPIFGEKDIANL